MREVVALWAGLLVEEGQREAEHEALRRAALEPMWRRELKHLREPGQQLELPLLTEEVILSAEWDALLSRGQLSAFLKCLPAREDPKRPWCGALGERLETDQTTRAHFLKSSSASWLCHPGSARPCWHAHPPSANAGSTQLS